MTAPIVMDIGAHDGADTWAYLCLGYRVVAVEANPKRAAEIHHALSHYVETGILVIHNVGIAEKSGEAPFYINPVNDLLSCFSREATERDGTPSEEVVVQTLPARFLFDAYGVPYYLKVDIEGSDRLVLQGLAAATSDRPAFLSIEMSDPSDIGAVADLGYEQFQLVNQRELPWNTNPSGPFGDALGNGWLNRAEVTELYDLMLQAYRLRLPPIEAWFDLHAKLG